MLEKGNEEVNKRSGSATRANRVCKLLVINSKEEMCGKKGGGIRRREEGSHAPWGFVHVKTGRSKRFFLLSRVL